MPLYYVTGIAGSGKSTAREELLSRGYAAYGTDEDGIASFYHKDTGNEYLGDHSATVRTPEWREEFKWRIDPEKINQLRSSMGDQCLYLCGVTSNDRELSEEFTKIVFLNVPPQILEMRVLTRTSHDYGKNPHELREILDWAKVAEQQYRDRGAVIIDGTRPVKDVVDDIIFHTQPPSRLPDINLPLQLPPALS
jgi:gluconate kinase